MSSIKEIKEEKHCTKSAKYTCKYCQKSYKLLKSYNNHLETHTELESDINFEKHKFEDKNNSKNWCNLCDKFFETRTEYEKHMIKRHLDNKKMKRKKCKICGDSVFNSEEEYLYHIKKIHDGKYIDYLMCEDCGKQFRTKSELKHHIESKCGTIKRFQCKVCHLPLMTAGSLHNHMLRHNGERCFMCRFCAKLFLTAGQLKVHERKHTQEKVFLCNVCGKGFSYRQSLITHSTIHTGIKPYQCENCGNSFSCIGNLLKHRKWHADTCGAVTLTTHRVNNPSTKIKVKVNTPATSRLKVSKKDKEIEDKLKSLDDKGICNKNLSKEDAETKANNLEDNESKELDTMKTLDYTISTVKATNNISSNRFTKMENNDQPDINNDSNNYETNQEKDENNDNFELTANSSDNASIQYENESFNTEKSDERKSECSKKIAARKCEIEKISKGKKVKKNECRYCGKGIINGKSLLRHEKRHEKFKNMYHCSCCKRTFNTKDERQIHQESEHTDVLTCQECDKMFSNKDSLKTHQRNTHEKIPRKCYLYICEKCGKEFKQKQTLQNHRESLCGTSLVYECEICHKKFTSVYIRKNHMKIHDVKKLLCKFCGKSFHWKGQLKVHERSHTGEKPYTCLYCPKAFSYRESLLTHSTIHTGIKPYVCESCGYGFSCIGNLIKHKDAHSNVCGPYNKVQM